MSPPSLLREWGGELDFDMGAYIAWRAREEGVELEGSDVRRYDAQAQGAQGAQGGGAGGAAQHPLENISSAALSRLGSGGAEGAEGLEGKRVGAVQKRGSGVGLFATTKWKPKLLAVAGGACVYYDSTALSEDSTPARFLSLAGAYAEPVEVGAKDKAPRGAPFMFRVVAPARCFQFACGSAQERDAWLAALRAGVEAAA